MGDAAVLFSRVGPEIGCELPTAKVRIAAFGGEEPVHFDINTVQRGIMRMIPGITEPEIESWIAARNTKAFASREDFQARAGLTSATLKGLKL